MKNLALFVAMVCLLPWTNISLFAQDVAAYTEQECTLSAQEGMLCGTLAVPQGTKKDVAVLLIAGSGPTDRDGNSKSQGLNCNTLRMIADSLAVKGYPTLRFDKRGVGKSIWPGLKELDLRFDTYIDDVRAWTKRLATVTGARRVVVAGHSEGALIGMAASVDNEDVAALISLDGAGLPAYSIIEKQTAQAPEGVRAEIKAINDSLRAGLLVSDVPSYLQTLFRPSVQPYMISWYRYDPAKVISRLTIPVLIVQGGHDIQVGTDNAAVLHRALPASELLEIAEMNHVMKKCASDNNMEQQAAYATPDVPLAPGLIDGLEKFLKALETTSPSN